MKKDNKIKMSIRFGDGHWETILCETVAITESGAVLYEERKGNITLLPAGYKELFIERGC